MVSFTVTTEPREDRQLAVAIQIAPEEVERRLRAAANKLAAQYRIPGFRKGKAPYHLVLQQFGLTNLYGEFVDDLGSEVFKAALEREHIAPYAQIALEEIKLDPLTYHLLVPLEPEVKLGDYRSLRLEESTSEIDESEVDAQLEKMRDEYASWGEVDRPSVYGDLMTLDVLSVIPASAEGDAEIVVLSETNWDVTPDLENPMEPPGFDQQLIGLAAGDEKEFVLGWPAESQSLYAGKEATFTVAVKKVEAYDKPELNDAFAQLAGPDFATLDDLKQSIRTSIELAQAASTRNQFASSVLDAVVAMSEITYPPAVIQDQLDGMVQDLDQRLRQAGIEGGVAAYLPRIGQTLEQYRASLEPQARETALRNLVLSEVIRTEQLVISDAELAEQAARVAGIDAANDADPAAEARSVIEFFTVGSGRNMLLSQMLAEKGVERLVAIARGEEIPAPGATPAADDAIGSDAESDAESAPESGAAKTE